MNKSTIFINTIRPLYLRQRGLTSRRQLRRGKILLLLGIVLGLITDGIGATLLSMARNEINGYLATSVDQYSWLITYYLSAKLVGFLIAPWLCGLLGTRAAITTALSSMVIVFCLSTLTYSLLLQSAFFISLGIAGATLLIATQALLFQTFPRPQQPGLQLLYAIGAATGAIALAPSIQGWILTAYDWRWIGTAAAGLGSLALLLISMTRLGERANSIAVRFDFLLVASSAVAALCFAFITTQGQRWNWMEAAPIQLATGGAIIGTLIAVVHLLRQQPDKRMVDLSIYRHLNFSFAFLASFVAGFALFGTAYLIPSYALLGLGMSNEQVALLLFPSTFTFIGAMFISVYVLPRLNIAPVFTVPAGIVLLIVSAWQLSHLAANAGLAELIVPILLRGAGVGFLFIAITLLALMWMRAALIAHGSALMSMARQLGGFIGTAFLGHVLAEQLVVNSQVLTAQLHASDAFLVETTTSIRLHFEQAGLASDDAYTAALTTLTQHLSNQAQALAWNRSFFNLMLFFLMATPTLILSRLLLLKLLGPPPNPPVQTSPTPTTNATLK